MVEATIKTKNIKTLSCYPNNSKYKQFKQSLFSNIQTKCLKKSKSKTKFQQRTIFYTITSCPN